MQLNYSTTITLVRRAQALLLAAVVFGLYPAAALAQARGQVTSRQCPHSCKTSGLAKSACRDWREGNTCYVEDLTKAPATPRPPHGAGWNPFERNPSGGTSRPTLQPQPTLPPYGQRPGGYEPPYGPDYKECRHLTGRYIARPRISIYRVDKTGNFFDDKFKVEGEVEGICLVDAGYFSRGRKQQSIPIRTNPNFQRFRFAVVIESGSEPEIRAYNVNGDSEVLLINPSDY